MRAYRVGLSLAIVTGCGIAVQNPAVSQENRGTMEQQMACTPDVFRLCGDQIPDVNRIVACLRQNTPQLSRPTINPDATMINPGVTMTSRGATTTGPGATMTNRLALRYC